MKGSVTALEPPKLEAVYYGSPIPLSKASLTLLAVVFDRLHFPNVKLPCEGFDPLAVAQEAERIERLGLRDFNSLVLVGALRALAHVNDLGEFCEFAAVPNQVFGSAKDVEVNNLALALEELVFGPPREGFIPTLETGYSKGLPGCDLSVDYPGTFHYPANAILYAARKGMPLVNDGPLPVPALGGIDAKNNANLLASVLALECVALVLPVVPPLSPREIVELRGELKGELLAFRGELLRLAAELNRSITENASAAELQSAANFVIKTSVLPALLELQNKLSTPKRSWTVRAFDAVKQVPELVSAFATLPPSVATAKLLAATGGFFVDLHEASNKREVARSPLYYLLRLRQKAGQV